jgi:hypothetical protein
MMDGYNSAHPVILRCSGQALAIRDRQHFASERQRLKNAAHHHDCCREAFMRRREV